MLSLGVLALTAGYVVWSSWCKRLERAKKVEKVLRQHSAQKTKDPRYPGLQVLLSGIDGTVSPSRSQTQRLRVFDHDDNQWLPRGGPFSYKTWNGRRASTSVHGNVVKQKGKFAYQHHLETCWPMLNWRGEPVYVCPTVHGTFFITDNKTKATHEDVQVKFLGPKNQRRTMTTKR